MLKNIFIIFAALLLSATVATASELRVNRMLKLGTTQPLLYLTASLYPKHAEKNGIKDAKVTFVNLPDSVTANEQMLAGNLDIVFGGINGFALLYDKMPKDVKLLAGIQTFDSFLICTNPEIKNIRDIKPNHKIAMRSINGGEHYTLRSYVVAAFGPENYKKLDNNIVVLPRDQVGQMMASGKSEVDCAILGSPWQNVLVNANQARIIDKPDGVKSFGFPNVVYTTSNFLEKNPKMAKAWIEAQKEAVQTYYADPKKALEYFLKEDNVTNITVDELYESKKFNNDIYSVDLGTALAYVDFMYNIQAVNGAGKNTPREQKIWNLDFIKK